MSDLSDLTGGLRGEVLPGHTLSRWLIRDYADCEAEFEREFIATVTKASVGAHPAVQQEMVRAATVHVGEGNLKYGSQGFDLQCFQPRWVPFLLWISLREREPKLSRDEAFKLVTRDNRNVVQVAILELLGLMNQKKKDEPKGEAEAGGLSGNESSPISAGNEISATTKSAA